MSTRQSILITGASAGLGEQMAREFAARGRDLALCARRTDRLERLREELLAAHPGVTVSVRALDVNDHGAVFEVFRAFRADLGSLDRVVVNAGLGKGRPIGTGRFDANLQTAQTNFTAALAQCEAAVEVFRDQGAGHLVVVSSMSAMRGLPRNLTTYAASKAGVAALAEGIRAELLRTPIKVTTLFPGYIASEMSGSAGRTPLMVSTEKGVRAMVKAIEAERAQAKVPAWPWVPMGFAMRRLPLGVVARMS
ncbi:SDR family oxidoreductase [Streptomyces verrucosisporus]|uniref:SDR family oxidoreductase n=1 Tax=Streptomyces verrucosisporus TaxID=1695161 RepID=UPI0019D04C39|nr:SDR family oxidoreductase [Streptomyces verrucosisporus]MBN3932660.1 SDR family oxidoreductase [Streptomyces verrucosisporus]